MIRDGAIQRTPSAATQLGAARTKLFRGFGDASRIAILATLWGGPHTVTEVVRETGLSQPNVSNHLACLRDCGLVTCARDGKFVRYRLSDERVGQLLQLATDLLAETATGVYQCESYDD